MLNIPEILMLVNPIREANGYHRIHLDHPLTERINTIAEWHPAIDHKDPVDQIIPILCLKECGCLLDDMFVRAAANRDTIRGYDKVIQQIDRDIHHLRIQISEMEDQVNHLNARKKHILNELEKYRKQLD